MSIDSTDVYRMIMDAKNSIHVPDISNLATINELDSFAESTKEQVYLLRDEDKRLQDEINGLKSLMEDIVKENKELKQEIEKLKTEKSDKDYYSLDI
ncbi:hypothetical protein [Streptobacillus moniliformis]|uniref:hypothetical protein n=1 Tax=Streptobacillus moniliformis TaxID=34105 RepID=UPI0007E4AB44|nr:hypothetical protein [Streptobacillus moniliformis]